MTIRRLPDGTYTEKNQEYIDAWTDLVKPIEDATGLVMYAFDPGAILCEPGRLSRTVSLPVWFIELLNKALAK